MRFVCYALIAALPALPGARAEERAEKKPATDVASYKPIAASAGKAKEVIVFEGFPHPLLEAKVFKKEKEERNQFRYQGHVFYQNRPKVKDKDAEALKKILADSKGFTAWRGEKKCGGFHPDYMIQWKDGDDLYRVLICYNCKEIMAYGPKGAMRLDMGRAGDSLQATLKRYQVLRPKVKKE
jgi:hypothetical protein